MSRRWLTILGSALVFLILAVLGVWAWLEGQAERAREASREVSIKEPPRRFVDEATGEVFIRLDAQGQRRLGLVTAPTQIIQRQKTLTLSGFSVSVPHRTAEVRAPWTGLLEADGELPTVGDEVRQGQTIGQLRVEWTPAERVQLENQVLEMRGVVRENAAEVTTTRKTVERLEKASEVVALKELIESKEHLDIFEARKSSAEERLKTLEEALSKQESRALFRVTVPQDGQLTELDARPGEIIPAGYRIATVYDSRELWVSALVLPRQWKMAGQPPAEATIFFPGFESQSFVARLVRIKPQVQRQQQAIELVYAAENTGGHVPVGIQANVNVNVGSPIDVLAVPRAAVLQLDDRRVVYVQRAPAEFIQKVVEVEDETVDRVFLRPTIEPNAQVVVRGAQSLLSEQNKEQIQLLEEGGEKK